MLHPPTVEVESWEKSGAGVRFERFVSNPVAFQSCGFSKKYAKRFCKTFSRPCSSGKLKFKKKPWTPRKLHHALQIHYKRREQEGKMKVAEPSAPDLPAQRAEIMDNGQGQLVLQKRCEA